MALKQTGFEGTTAGDTVTATNGGTGNTALTIGTTGGSPAPTLVYSSTTPIHGARGMRLTAITGATTRVFYADPVTPSFTAAFGYKSKATPTGGPTEIYYLTEGTSFDQKLAIAHTTTNTVTVKDASGVTNTISGVTLVTDTAYRIEVYGSLAGSPTTSNATYTVKVFTGDSTTALGTYTTSSGNLGTVGFIRQSLGKHSPTGTMDSIFDDFRANLGSSAALGPVDLTLSSTLALSPTSGTVPYTLTATVSYTGGTGTPVTYSMDWGDGTTSAAQSSNIFTHSVTVAGTYTATSTTLNT